MTVYDIARGIMTQSNRGTMDPYIIVLQEKVEVHVPDVASYDRVKVYDPYWNESFESEEHWEKVCKEHELCGAEISDRRQNIVEYHVEDQWVDRNWFFTDEGYEQHVALNKHNYRGEIRSYLMHCYRNPEMKALFEHLRGLYATPHP